MKREEAGGTCLRFLSSFMMKLWRCFFALDSFSFSSLSESPPT